MSSPINSKTLYQANTKKLKGWYSNYAKLQETQYSDFFNVFDNDPRMPHMTMMPINEFGLMKVKPEGQNAPLDALTEGDATTFNFVTFGLGYAITEEAREESPADILQTLPARLVDAEKTTKEFLFANMFNLAAVAGVNGADGVPLLSTAHPLPAVPGQTYSNFAGNTALSPESINAGIVSMKLTPSDRGNPSERIAQDLIVHPQREKEAVEIIGSDLYPYSNENRLNYVKGKLTVKTYRYLTNPLSWFITAGKADYKSGKGHSLGISFKYQNRNAERYDEMTGTMYQAARFRCTYGWLNWRGFFGSLGS